MKKWKKIIIRVFNVECMSVDVKVKYRYMYSFVKWLHNLMTSSTKDVDSLMPSYMNVYTDKIVKQKYMEDPFQWSFFLFLIYKHEYRKWNEHRN